MPSKRDSVARVVAVMLMSGAMALGPASPDAKTSKAPGPAAIPEDSVIVCDSHVPGWYRKVAELDESFGASESREAIERKLRKRASRIGANGVLLLSGPKTKVVGYSPLGYYDVTSRMWRSLGERPVRGKGLQALAVSFLKADTTGRRPIPMDSVNAYRNDSVPSRYETIAEKLVDPDPDWRVHQPRVRRELREQAGRMGANGVILVSKSLSLQLQSDRDARLGIGPSKVVEDRSMPIIAAIAIFVPPEDRNAGVGDENR